MVKEITKQASTVEEATELALQELNIKKEKAKIEIISTGGLFENAEVKVSVQDNALEMVTEFLNGIIAKMGMKISAKITEDKDDISIIITGEDAAKVIAHRGEVLDSFQVIILSYLNQYGYEHKKVSIDCDSYREKRTATLSALAVKMANKAYSMGREIEFEPMNPFERRVIHTALQDSTIVKTQSEGEEPNRYVVLVPNTDIVGPRFKARGQENNNKDRRDNKSKRNRPQKHQGGNREVADGREHQSSYVDLDTPYQGPKTTGAPKFKSFGTKKF